MNKIFTFIKLFYYLLPKIIREQYLDSIEFYKLIFIHNFNKIMNKTQKRIVTLVDEIDQLNIPSKILFRKENRINRIESPKLYIAGDFCYKESIEGFVPDIEVYLLSDVNVVGSTDALVHNNKMHHYELSNMDKIHDLKCFDIFTLKTDSQNKYELNVKNIKLNDDLIYISLLKEHSINYYHFITEALPRLTIILSILEDNFDIKKEDFTILIDKGMPTQCKDIIQSMITKNIKIKEIDRGSLVNCKKLIYCTPLWLSLDNTKYLPNPKKEFFVDTYALDIVKNKIVQQVDKKYNIKNNKIYLQRLNNKLRSITNIVEVEKFLYKHNFDFIDTSTLSFEEQVNLFSNAKIIIGASGASFTNMLFMQEDSTVISFYPSAQSTNYYVFQPLSDIANINFIHFLTEPEDYSNSVHGNASVNINELNKLLKDIDI